MSIRAEKCQIHLKQKQFSNERFLKQTLLRPSTGLSGKLKTSSKRHLESLHMQRNAQPEKSIVNYQPARKLDMMRRTQVT